MGTNGLPKSSIDNLLGYTGGRFDQESGNYHFRARQYEPKTGRFISRDPLGYVNGPNPYTYVNSNPTNWVDAFGLEKGNPGEIPGWHYDPRSGGYFPDVVTAQGPSESPNWLGQRLDSLGHALWQPVGQYLDASQAITNYLFDTGFVATSDIGGQAQSQVASGHYGFVDSLGDAGVNGWNATPFGAAWNTGQSIREGIQSGNSDQVWAGVFDASIVIGGLAAGARMEGEAVANGRTCSANEAHSAAQL